MKNTRLINSNISSVIAQLGHTDMIVIADCSISIPKNVNRIDLALERGKPSFIETLDVVLSEMTIEKITLVNEIISNNPQLLTDVLDKMIKFPIVGHDGMIIKNGADAIQYLSDEDENPFNSNAIKGVLELENIKYKDTNSKLECEIVSYEDFKSIMKNSIAVIRTGENTPYANIILHSGIKY